MSDWRKQLEQAQGGPPAQGGTPGATRRVNPNLIDVSARDEPVNAFGYAAAVIRTQREIYADRFRESPEEKAATDERLAWLDTLAVTVPFQTTHVVEALAISRLACHKGARDTFIAALQGVIEVGTEMTAQRAAGAGPKP